MSSSSLVFSNIQIEANSLEEFASLYIDNFPHLFKSVDPKVIKQKIFKSIYVKTFVFIMENGPIDSLEKRKEWIDKIVSEVPTTPGSLRTQQTKMKKMGLIYCSSRGRLEIPKVLLDVVKNGEFDVKVKISKSKA